MPTMLDCITLHRVLLVLAYGGMLGLKIEYALDCCEKGPEINSVVTL